MTGPVLRIFEARTKPGRANELLENFASTSAGVVAGEPGNRGYIFGKVSPGTMMSCSSSRSGRTSKP